ncbi:helix-turn-helix transcriptional regulator [Candidatus Bathyarchaeota archaeon]|nr:helix-turn-helix transcriptional regulator [Candidatus Bathyarchaeota archaeon]
MSDDLERSLRERLVKSHLDWIVLWLLKAKPRWGYEINIEIRERFRVYLSAGTLYPLLHSLEGRRFLEGVWESEKGRGRRIYRITEEGRSFLAAGERISQEFLRRLGSDPGSGS